MSDNVTITINDQTFHLPVILGYDGSRAIDVTFLKQLTGLITFDPGFNNTAGCKSQITYIDGDRGILRYRGIPIEELAENAKFIEVAYLLINGELPNRKERNRFSTLLNDNSLVHEDMKYFFQKFPRTSHPMGILSAMVTALKSFYPYLIDIDEEINITVTRLLSKIRTLAAMSYKISKGHKVVLPRYDLTYCENFLNMMFDSPVHPYIIDQEIVDALNAFLIVHADHEQNCSTFAVRVVGSGKVNLYAAISAGIAALWGPLHGSANQKVYEIFEAVFKKKITIDELILRTKDPMDAFVFPGIRHRVYRTYDPRARIMKKLCEKIHSKLDQPDPLLDVALEIEHIILNDDYFIQKKIFPNINFFSGLLLAKMGIPANMFPVMFTIGRLPGWIANWKEMNDDPNGMMARPRQIYIGSPQKAFTPIEDRPV